jgi:hypothetical protein
LEEASASLWSCRASAFSRPPGNSSPRCALRMASFSSPVIQQKL